MPRLLERREQREKERLDFLFQCNGNALDLLFL